MSVSRRAETLSAVGAELQALEEDDVLVWRNETAGSWSADDDAALLMDQAHDRFRRFAPLLSNLFPEGGFSGHIRSTLTRYPDAGLGRTLLVKHDHALPLTGSVKARGGVHQVLHIVEAIAIAEGLISGSDKDELCRLSCEASRRSFARHRLVVGSTGNLGFSIGLMARRFGAMADIHMSREAAGWKKERLRAIGATVIEHDTDFTGAVEAARRSCEGDPQAHFIDDERSPLLFAGYAAAAYEVADQLASLDQTPTPLQPLAVFLPCGVGGAPCGITFGLKRLLGSRAIFAVLVEPAQAACMHLALRCMRSIDHVPSVYEAGLTNRTCADGLAVARASPLALEVVGRGVDASAVVQERSMIGWVKRAHREAGLRLEAAAASAFSAAALMPEHLLPPHAARLAWTTGGALLPAAQFEELLALRS